MGLGIRIAINYWHVTLRPPRYKNSIRSVGLETGSAAQDYIQLYEGDAKLLSERLEYIQQTATRILNAIGAEGSSAPPA